MTYKELIAILQAHKAWLNNEKVGQCADLSHINLYGYNLSDADLSYADLSYANLTYTHFRDANLSYAKLTGANFRGAILVGTELNNAKLNNAKLNNANLSEANLSEANLNGVNLREANLSDIKTDFLAALFTLPAEVPFLRKTLIGGKIDGTAYRGKCCCLAGTMAHACGTRNFDQWAETTSFPIDLNSARERWFLAIRPGMTPANNQVAAITLEWIDEFLMVQS